MYPKFPYPRITAVVCTLNEEKSIVNVLPKIPIWVDEVLLIDGHSTDRTVGVAKEICPRIKVFYQPNRGKGDALKYGFKQSNEDIIVTLDADGATNPQEMDKFIEMLIQGHDFAKGSRFLLSLPAKKASHRLLGNLLIAATFNLLYFTRYTDLCSGYNAFWRKKFNNVNLFSKDCFEDEPLIIARARKSKLKIGEVGHLDLGRNLGESKSPSMRQGFKAIKTITRERICA
jgi:glycosyltransferase involved in cell wall biosynthesis